GSAPCKDKDLPESEAPLGGATDEDEKVPDRSCGDKESEVSGLEKSEVLGYSASDDGSEPVKFLFPDVPEVPEEEGSEEGAAAFALPPSTVRGQLWAMIRALREWHRGEWR
ncbi:MAG: hypothetical protein CMP27_13860, partial [Roseibacillus sp.]|nr:hypothetical protein [Roseibacillus sp.]